MVNIDKQIEWAKARRGYGYNMSGSRNGSDGTFDCSSFICYSIQENGGTKMKWVYNTDSMHDYLIENGYELISFNKSWDMKKGDIIITGIKGQSGGAAGHTALAIDGTNIIDCAWYGAVNMDSVRIHPESDMPYGAGFYVYRLKNGGSSQTPSKPSQSSSEWIKETGVYRPDSATNLRTGASTSSGVIATLPPKSAVKYDAYKVDKNGYLWIRQPRSGGYGYMATGRTQNGKRVDWWGSFSAS